MRRSKDDYELLLTLYKGKRGRIIQARHKTTRELRALRVVTTKTELEAEVVRQEFRSIATVTQECVHLCEHEQPLPSAKDKQVWVPMEYCNAGTLQQLLLRNERKPLHLLVVADIGAALVAALQQAHRNDILHGGITPRQVHFTSSGRCKLGGLGTRPSKRGALPPEVRNGSPWTPKADVYQLGMLLRKIGGRSSDRRDPFTDFVRRCVRTLPSKRADLETLAKHPFIAKRLASLLQRGCSRYVQAQLKIQEANYPRERSKEVDQEMNDDEESQPQDVLSAALNFTCPKPAHSHSGANDPASPEMVKCLKCSASLPVPDIARTMGFVCGNCGLAHNPSRGSRHSRRIKWVSADDALSNVLTNVTTQAQIDGPDSSPQTGTLASFAACGQGQPELTTTDMTSPTVP